MAGFCSMRIGGLRRAQRIDGRWRTGILLSAAIGEQIVRIVLAFHRHVLCIAAHGVCGAVQNRLGRGSFIVSARLWSH